MDTQQTSITPTHFPVDLWPEILKSVEDPQVVLVCKLFNKIYNNRENTYRWLTDKLNFKGLYHISKTIKPENLESAKTGLLARLIMHRPQSTLNGAKKYEELPFHGFLKILEEENSLNLIHAYNKIPLEGKPDFNHLELSAQAKAIRAFLKEQSPKMELIEKLDLCNVDLTAVPEELNLMTGLKEINLTWNRIDSLPPTFGMNWEKLEKCELSFNRLRIIPEQFGSRWPELKIIYINNNLLTSLPQHFGASWKKLEEYNLKFNNLTDLPLTLPR